MTLLRHFILTLRLRLDAPFPSERKRLRRYLFLRAV
jgi:hypothetical protein